MEIIPALSFEKSGFVTIKCPRAANGIFLKEIKVCEGEMRRICHVGLEQDDSRARKLVEKVREVDGVSLIPVPFSLNSSGSHLETPDFFVKSATSSEVFSRKDGISVPLILIGEFFRNGVLEIPERVYFTNGTPLNFYSLMRALFETSPNLKVELRGGIVVNLYHTLKETTVEKVVPTGKRIVRHLAYKEGVILREFLSRPGEVVPYSRLEDLGIKKENIPVYVSRLRRVLEEIDPMIQVRSIRNKGYFVVYGL